MTTRYYCSNARCANYAGMESRDAAPACPSCGAVTVPDDPFYSDPVLVAFRIGMLVFGLGYLVLGPYIGSVAGLVAFGVAIVWRFLR